MEKPLFVKSELHIFEHPEVRTTYFVKSELHIGEKREVKATYFVKSKLYIEADCRSNSINSQNQR